MNRRSFLLAISSAIGTPSLVFTSGIPDFVSQDEDALLCARKFEFATSRDLHKRPINEVIVEIGKSFLGTEYVAHSLEEPGEERLVINLRSLDCVLFCENCLALSRCIKKNRMTFDAFKAELQYIRYRGGRIDRYPSRLHYFSDHIYDNERKGVVKDVTRQIGGIVYAKTINFMSTHTDSYPKLKEHPEFVKIIEQQEAELNKRTMYHIPATDIGRLAKKICNGDIIAITSDIEGMDMAHTGIAVWQKQKLHFMHAPNVGRKVVISESTLAEYVAGNKKQIGIMVARPLEPV